jgi:hypothetical protein
LIGLCPHRVTNFVSKVNGLELVSLGIGVPEHVKDTEALRCHLCSL